MLLPRNVFGRSDEDIPRTKLCDRRGVEPLGRFWIDLRQIEGSAEFIGIVPLSKSLDC